MITLDASVVVAHLSPGDLHHHVASAFFQGVVAEDLVMHSLNLAEVLVGGAKAGRGQEMLEDLRAIGIRVAERPQDEALRLANLQAETGLKLPDCCALDTALLTGSTLATFDDALANAARQRDLTVAPAPETENRAGESQ